MKKHFFGFLLTSLLLLSSVVVIFANQPTNRNEIVVTGDSSQENLPGISSFYGGSGQMLTREHTNSIYSYTFGSLVGTYRTQAFWEVSDKLLLLNYGVAMNRATPANGSRGSAEIGGIFSPAPSVARVNLTANFTNVLDYYTISHHYYLYNGGFYDISIYH